MGNLIGSVILNILCALVSPVLFPILLIWLMRVNDWPRRRRSCMSEQMLQGKTVLITGATSGVGKETTRELAKRGAKVLMACRNVEKAKVVCNEIKGETGNSDLHILELDVSDLESIRSCALQILKTETHLEYLINNAGILNESGKTKQGYNKVIGTNYVGAFLLTHLLSELLKKSAPSRVINVSSCDYSRVRKMDLSYCTTTPSNALPAFQLYPLSKLALVLHAKELGRRLKGTGVTTYSLHPGFVYTNISQGIHQNVVTALSFLYNTVERLAGLDLKTGCQTSLHCVLEESIAKDTGKYYDNCREKELSTAFSKDDHLSAELWDATLASLRQNGYLN